MFHLGDLNTFYTNSHNYEEPGQNMFILKQHIFIQRI